MRHLRERNFDLHQSQLIHFNSRQSVIKQSLPPKADKPRTFRFSAAGGDSELSHENDLFHKRHRNID
jgi:hypothetical protein